MSFENFIPPKINKSTKEKVSPTGPEYLENIEFRQAEMNENATDYCFGDSLLKIYKMRQDGLEALRNQDHVEIMQEYDLEQEDIAYEEQEFEIDKIRFVTGSQKEFIDRADRSGSSKYIQKFIRESLDDPILSEKLKTIITNLPEKARKRAEAIKIELTPKEKLMFAFFGTDSIALTIKQHLENMYVLEAIRNNRIPASEWIDMVSIHRDVYVSEKKKILDLIPEFKETIRTEIERAIDAGEIPLSKEKLHAVLERTQVDVSDGIDSITEKNAGFYIAARDGIYLSTILLSEKLDKTEVLLYRVYVHELFHALSGKTIIQNKETFLYKQDDGASEFENHNTMQAQRIGLRILSKFTWLNEAVTECLTIQHDGRNEAQEKNFTILKEKKFESDEYGYRPERELFELLISKYDLPIELFLKAYFEDYLPEERHSEVGAIPCWKELYSIINERCGIGLLVTLDKEIQEKGIRTVVKEFKEKHQIL